MLLASGFVSCGADRHQLILTDLNRLTVKAASLVTWTDMFQWRSADTALHSNSEELGNICMQATRVPADVLNMSS